MYSKQVQRQRNTPEYAGRRELDFSPFQAALAGRDASLDRWVPRASVAELHQALKEGKTTSRQLVLCFVQRIERYQDLRAVGELNPDALAIAGQLDAETLAGKIRGPLHGIPVLLKDNIATGDRMHNTAGALAMEHGRAPRDSNVAGRLRADGAILLGKANMSEWANFMTDESANGFSALGGQVRNPYGKFDVSGSSSGSAAGVAAGLAPLTVGTETCGSLISPGSANSLAVLKPGLGLVSRDLIIPITAVTDTAGPMARRVSDLAALFQAMIGVDERDPVTRDGQAVCKADCAEFLDASALKGVRVGWVTNLHAHPGEQQVIEKARGVLRDCGAQVVDVALRHAVRWPDVMQVFSYGMKHDVQRYLEAVKGYAPFTSLEEVVRFNAADLANRAPFGQDLLESAVGIALSAEAHAGLAEKIRRVSGEELRRLRVGGEVDVLVSMGGALSGYHAIAGLPALTVPAGYTASGRPVGLTFTGERFEDGKLIALGYAFEQASQARRDPL